MNPASLGKPGLTDTSSIKASVLRILNSQGETVGAGILVADRLAATCAHVIEKAGGQPGSTITTEVCLTGVRVNTAVLEEGWSPSKLDDVAFLRVLNNLPSGIAPMHLGSSDDCLGRPFAAFGFPKDPPYKEHWALGLLAAPVRVHDGRRPVLQFQGSEIIQGMSGGPVIDVQTGQVVGMVCEYKDHDRARKAYAVTGETLKHYCPQKLELHPRPAPDESNLAAWFGLILESLTDLQTKIGIIAESGASEPSFLIAGAKHSFSLSHPAADEIIKQVQGREDSEKVYLTRFILDRNYSRWEHEYLELPGRLTEPPALTNLRLRDRDDPRFSAAGEKLDDLRQAITKFNKPHLVILGEPGCGKTTTLDRLALDLARQRLRTPQSGKIPFRVDLDEFGDKPPDPASFLRRKWQESGLASSYDEAVLRGEVCFLLDGVNQMPFDDRADRVDRWDKWVHKLSPGNWAVFTCRSLDYAPRLSLPEVYVQHLDESHIQRYLELRLGDDPELFRRASEAFKRRFRSGDQHFKDLARNIFWLALLVERAAEDRTTSNNRAELMDDLVTRRIDREFKRLRQPQKLRNNPTRAYDEANLFLSRLGYAMQESGGVTVIDKASIPTKISLTGLKLINTHEEALKLGLDSGLLEEKTERGQTPSYAFYHHLLQEFFAGQELLRRFRAGENLEKRWRVRWKAPDELSDPLPEDQTLPPPPTTGWEETTRMAAALAGEDLERLVRAVARCNLPLAGRCLAEAGGEGELAKALRGKLLARQRDRRAHLRARIDAGLALGELGHPELRPQPFAFEGQTVWAILPPMQQIRAGTFIFGSSRENKEAIANEYADPRQKDLPAFSIGRYPVTNAEYRYFYEAGGYDEKRWWDQAGWEWRQGGAEAHRAAIEEWMRLREWLQGIDLEEFARQVSWWQRLVALWQEVIALSEPDALKRAERIFSRPFDRPAFWDDADLSAPARPVVGVNWHEARAYCTWLSAVTGREFTLPEELQWEKAARGVDGREYPWEGDHDPRRCNTAESRIGLSTPVGTYADGVSPFGLFDAAGEVWEWTADWYQVYPGGDPQVFEGVAEKYRVGRGGSWSGNQRDARCAFRLWYVPVIFGSNLGFRVSSPGSISAS